MHPSSSCSWRRMAAMAVLFAAGAIGGCSLGTEAWERDRHADPEMALEHDGVDQALDEHIYFSKEASSGGQGFGGGGCGCN